MHKCPAADPAHVAFLSTQPMSATRVLHVSTLPVPPSNLWLMVLLFYTLFGDARSPCMRKKYISRRKKRKQNHPRLLQLLLPNRRLCTQRTGHHIRFLTCQITNPRQHRQNVFAILHPSLVERWLSIPFTQPIDRYKRRSHFQLLFRMMTCFVGRERASPTSVQNSSTIDREMPGALRGADT